MAPFRITYPSSIQCFQSASLKSSKDWPLERSLSFFLLLVAVEGFPGIALWALLPISHFFPALSMAVAFEQDEFKGVPLQIPFLLFPQVNAFQKHLQYSSLPGCGILNTGGVQWPQKVRSPGKQLKNKAAKSLQGIGNHLISRVFQNIDLYNLICIFKQFQAI